MLSDKVSCYPVSLCKLHILHEVSVYHNNKKALKDGGLICRKAARMDDACIKKGKNNVPLCCTTIMTLSIQDDETRHTNTGNP